MALYDFSRPEGDAVAYQPAAGPADIVTLESVANVYAEIREVSWGGSDTASTQARTRLCLDTAVGTGGRTAATVKPRNPNSHATACFGVTSYATTAPTHNAAGVFEADWNSQGGEVFVAYPPGGGYILIGAGSYTLRNIINTQPTSAYHICYDEP